MSLDESWINFWPVLVSDWISVDQKLHQRWPDIKLKFCPQRACFLPQKPSTEILMMRASLADLDLNKMADIVQTTFSKAFFLNENYHILIHISLKFIPQDLIDNKSGLVQVMALHQPGDKPLPESMLTKISYAIGCHYATMCQLTFFLMKMTLILQAITSIYFPPVNYLNFQKHSIKPWSMTNYHWFDNGLAPQVPSHYLHQWWSSPSTKINNDDPLHQHL